MAKAAAPGRRRAWRWRLAGWGTAAAILLAHLVAMQFTDEVAWSPGDFLFAGVLMGSVGLAFELTARLTRNSAYRAGVAAALAAAFLLIWLNAAVGIIGTENNRANLMYAGVLAVALAGAMIARFRSAGMARAMAAAALAQALVGAIALASGAGADGPSWPGDVLGLTLIFSALWLGAAWLFRRAAAREATRTNSAA